MIQRVFKIRTVAGLIVGFLLGLGQALAANTVVATAHTIDVSAMDSDYTMGGAQEVDYIIFQPGAQNDVLYIADVSNPAKAPRRVYIKASDAYTKFIPMGGVRIKLMIDYSNCTLTAGAFVIIGLSKR